MSVNHMLVDPRVISGRIYFTGSQHSISDFAVDLIAINVQGVRERVVGTELLELTKGLAQQIRVHQTDVCRGSSVTGKCATFRGGFTRVIGVFDIGNVIAFTSEFNVSLDVFSFHGLLGWSYPVLLNQEGVNRTGDQGSHEETSDTNNRQAPPTGDPGCDEQTDNPNRADR